MGGGSIGSTSGGALIFIKLRESGDMGGESIAVESIAIVAWGGDANARGALIGCRSSSCVTHWGGRWGGVAVLARLDSISPSGWSAVASLVPLIWDPESCSSSSSASVS